MTDVEAEIRKAFLLDGFMYQARHMVFDELAAARLIASIENIGPEADPNARNAIVRTLWQIPFLRCYGKNSASTKVPMSENTGI
ncbi:hypothetical protein LP421_27580 [Rhizobium sp. RCAM05350]|nr:hypothetical protein LP421_27580 [Rhizobium sp. RCAM05350]